MRMKSIELYGFKSFPDRTVLRFDSNVTAIVGPNGCGKSNVMDAIRWAMGEQSAKALRGRQMDDVVFVGSDSRSALAMAEVTLTFSTEDGLVPVKYAAYREIAVTRRMFREGGESLYLINKVPVRLRDVTDLFLGTGAGTRAYSLIEQGRVGYIVSARPQDRRLLIEEAAGISRYRAKRVSTERQIAATEQNLLRIGDRLRDKEDLAASLRRQAQKAERFRAYRDEQRAIDVRVAAHDALARLALAGLLARERKAASEELEAARSALAVVEARVGCERALASDLEAAVGERQSAVWELSNRVQLAEAAVRQARADIARLRERDGVLAEQRSVDAVALARGSDELAAQRAAAAEAAGGLGAGEARLAATEGTFAGQRDALRELEEDLADARRTHVAALQADGQIRAALDAAVSAMAECSRRRVETAERRAELVGMLAGADGALAAARSGLDATRSDHQAATSRVEELRAEIEAVRGLLAQGDVRVRERTTDMDRAESRLASLREIAERHEAYGTGVRALLERGAAGEASGAGAPDPFRPLGDLVSCDEGYEAALAAVMGDTLQRVVCDRRAHAFDALRFLREGTLGRAAITPLEGWTLSGRSGAPAGVEGAERLADHVRAPAGVAPLVDELLSGVLVVSSLSQAESARARGSRSTCVTAAGDVSYADGTLCGGSAEDRFAAFLHQKAERARIDSSLPGLRLAVEEALAGHDALRARLRGAQERFDEACGTAHRREIETARRSGDLSAIESDRRRLETDLAAADALLGELDRGLEDGDAAIARLRSESAAAARRVAAVDAALVALAAEVDGGRARLDAIAADRARERERVAAAHARVDTLGVLVRSLEERLAELAREDALRTREAEANARDEGASRGRLVAGALALADLTFEHEHLGEALRMAQVSFEEHRSSTLDMEASLRGRRERITELTARVGDIRSEAEAAEREVAFLAARLADRHQVTVDQAISDHHASPQPDENARRRAEELRGLLDRMGGVNLTAIEEYEATRRIVEETTRQKEDLEKALADLRAAIGRMNRESRARFRATFDAVNDLFQKVFPKMFRGGRAHLALTDSDDMLEAGIDIVAQPPGKKLQSIDLLSGGEKALTAVSLVFALFLYKPSPFCVLDEVDAPLDDANVGRFCDFVRELADRTQFVLVTHVKQTMERCDVLYGVTMEEPGVSKIVSVRLKDSSRSGRAANAA